MAELDEHSDPTTPTAPRDDVARPGMPRWVKASLAAVAALVVLFILGQVIGVGGDHGSGRHGGDDGRPSVVDEDGGHRPPVDHGE